MQNPTASNFVNFAKDFKVPHPDKASFSNEDKNHTALLNHICELIKSSEQKMCKFYPRWRAAELRVLAFAESQLAKQKQNETCDVKQVDEEPTTDMAVPYIFSTMQTICTYMLQTFAGRKPMLQLGAYDPENLKKARLMEKKIQYDADHTKLINKLWNWFWNSQLYGFGTMNIEWTVEKGLRQVVNPSVGVGSDNITTQEKVLFEGNKSTVIDPFLFYPDPSVPLSDLATEGEFASWRSFKRKNYIRKQGLQGFLAHYDKITTNITNHNDNVNQLSFRDRVSGADSSGTMPVGMVQVDKGVFEIIPEDFGFEPTPQTAFEPKMPAKWMIIMLNKSVIAYAAPYQHNHNKLPFATIEPYGDGHTFGSIGVPDLLADTQEAATFFLDSHIKSMKQVINQKILVDPSVVNMSDFKSKKSGALVRVKQGSQGSDVNLAIKDFTPNDPTSSNIASLATIMHVGDLISGTNDNLRGQQTNNSTKTATEVRSSNESSSNRMAAQSMRMSSQGISDIKEISALNNMQFLSDDFELLLHGEKAVQSALGQNPQDLLGPDEQDTEQKINRESIIGDFFFPIHDGTLPMDKVAITQLWTQLFQVVLSDPELRQGYDLFKLFDRIAYLGGAENIEEFRSEQGRELAIAQALAGAAQGGIPQGGVQGGGGSPGGANPVPQAPVR